MSIKTEYEKIERHCRLNGKKPTMREKWTAFYRLWRMTGEQKRKGRC